MKTLYDQKERVTLIIDSGSWNHSWHLPKNEQTGYIDWFCIETRDKIVAILKEKREQAAAMIALIDAIDVPPESFYE